MSAPPPLLVVSSVAAVGLALSVLQIPAIPSGPAWAVAITLLGSIILLVIKEVGKIRRSNGERVGTRTSDDHHLDRQQIQDTIKLLADAASTLGIVQQFAKDLPMLEALLQRTTVAMEAIQKTQQINTGILEMVIRNQMTIDERLQHMPTTAEFLREGERRDRLEKP